MKTLEMMTSCTGCLHPAEVQSGATPEAAPEHTTGDVDGSQLYRITPGCWTAASCIQFRINPLRLVSTSEPFKNQDPRLVPGVEIICAVV